MDGVLERARTSFLNDVTPCAQHPRLASRRGSFMLGFASHQVNPLSAQSTLEVTCAAKRASAASSARTAPFCAPAPHAQPVLRPCTSCCTSVSHGTFKWAFQHDRHVCGLGIKQREDRYAAPFLQL